MLQVLIVEHDPTSIAMVQSLHYYADDFAITLAESGAAAVRILQEQPIDIVSTDIGIQVQDGVNLLAYILKQDPLKPLLVHTALDIDDIRAKISSRGYTSIAYIQKPFAMDAYLAALRSLAANAQPDSPAQAMLAPLPYDSWSEELISVHAWQSVPQPPAASSPDDTTLIHRSLVGKDLHMATVQQSLETAMEIDGALGAALVDYESGMALGMAGGSSALNLEVAAAGNTNVVRAKMKVMGDLNLNDSIEDILITLNNQYHLIRLLKSSKGLFLYLVLSKSQSNLALARHKLSQVEASLTV
jgi:DNA-binding response OmpR family regulator